jgi:PAS domain S-box-containing protein
MPGGLPEASATRLDDAQFRALADTAPDAIVTGDASGRIAYVNPAAELLFGHPAARMIGQGIPMLMPEDLRAAHHAGFERFIRTGRGHLVGRTVEVTGLRADGHVFPMELSLGSAGEGAARTLTAVIRDLTARRRQERHLAAQLAVTSVLAAPHEADEAVARIVEELTRALEWDVGALWMVGPDAGQTLELRHLWQADPSRTRTFADATARLALDPSRGIPLSTLQRATPAWLDDLPAQAGFVRHAEATACGLRAGIWLPLLTGGRPIGVIECFTREPLPVDGQLRDLLMTVASQVGEYLARRRTEMRLEEERARFAADLARSNAELEEFAQVAAHDLHTPLRTIAGLTELVLRDHGRALPDRAREYLETTVASATAGGRLLDSLLTYARAGASGRPHERVEPGEVVAEVLASLSVVIEHRGAKITVDELPPVRGDAVQLGQLFQNLIANAIKFTPQERIPAIAIGAGAGGSMVEFRVRDNGMGIAPEDGEGLFAMLRRGDRSAAYDGAGIGLAVCARIVERHGGRIWCEPASPCGTVFVFTLPTA